jgi:hypothetical protein
MRVTFLQATNGLSLSKYHSTNEGFRPYPHVKKVTSSEYDLPVSDDGLQELEQLIRSEGRKGFCMLKGNLKAPLFDESRAGKSNKNELSNLLILDIDGVVLPKPLQNNSKITSADVANLANQCIAELPIEMRDVSYIAQASSSLGMKGNKTSLHIFMLLNVAMPAKAIKLFLQDANFESDVFSDQLSLSVNGQSLKYPLDPSVADNSKIIFIAPPTFENTANDTFASDDDRVVLVDRMHSTFNLAALMANISPQRCYEKGQKIKDKLRDDSGFSKRQTKTRITTIDSSTEEVLTNPDKMSILITDESSFPYIRCNINGGDSGAYYFNMKKPIYMYNFKDEPLFEIEKADPDFYMSIFERYEERLEEVGQAERPIVLRDYATDTFFNGIYNPNEKQFAKEYPLTPISKMNIEDFFMNHGKVPPDFIPDGRVVFDPTSNEEAVNFTNTPYYVNTYQRSEYVRNCNNPDEPLTVGSGHKLKNACPTIHKIIYHILGNGNEEYERFINWLAYIYQTRNKSGVSWVMTGTQGTGKGIFYSKILRGLFGRQHVPMKFLQSMEEQFNLYMRDALFLVVDEFHMASASSSAGKMADKLKNQITEPTITIRGMRSNQVEVENYTNYIFLTNRVDAVNIENGDRRYNIAPKQDVKLLDAFPEMAGQLDSGLIEKELYDFAGILNTYEVNSHLAKTAINNLAKEQMRNVSMSVFEEFCQALKDGKLNYFTDILDINTASVIHANEIEAAQRLVKSWIAQGMHEYLVIPMEHLRTVFHVQTEQNPRLSQREFSKRMNRSGIETERKRPFKSERDTNPMRGVVTTWETNELELKRLTDQYFEEHDKKLLLSF